MAVVYFRENICPVVSGIRFETTMDRPHSRVDGCYISKNNGKMLFGWMLYICSRYVPGRRQQQGRKRLEEFHVTGHSKLLAFYNVISDKSHLFLATGFY
jgi:hypothetical protein